MLICVRNFSKIKFADAMRAVDARTNKEFANMLGISQSSVSKFISGFSKPSRKVFAKIVHALGYQPEQLLDIQPPEHRTPFVVLEEPVAPSQVKAPVIEKGDYKITLEYTLKDRALFDVLLFIQNIKQQPDDIHITRVQEEGAKPSFDSAREAA